MEYDFRRPAWVGARLVGPVLGDGFGPGPDERVVQYASSDSTGLAAVAETLGVA